MPSLTSPPDRPAHQVVRFQRILPAAGGIRDTKIALATPLERSSAAPERMRH
jgi:hypothetical protein